MQTGQVGKRLAQFLSSIKKTVNASARELDMHPSQLYNIVKGKNYGVTYLFQVLRYYKALNPMWLMYGEGEMYKDDNKTLSTKTIPIYDISGSAGRNISFFADDASVVEHIFLGSSFKDCTAAIRIYGDSMYPLYQSGDLALLKRIQEHAYFQWGHVYLIVTADDRFLKHVLEVSGNKEQLLLKSQNEYYKPFKINKKDILSIHEAQGYIRKIKM